MRENIHECVLTILDIPYAAKDEMRCYTRTHKTNDIVHSK